MAPHQQLMLHALDWDDLKVLSAQCQDALVRSVDFAYTPAAERFTFMCNRFDWLDANAREKPSGFERRQSIVSFARVTRARFAGFEHAAGGRILSLLAIVFEPGDAPAGVIRLQFAAGAEVRLDVECIEVELKDTGAVWAAGAKPDHSAARTK